MQTIFETYTLMIDQRTPEMTASAEQWQAFLRCAVQMYKYPFSDQLMIALQRPEARVCASYEFWKNRMHRFVRRGADGIALIDESGTAPKLKYVFDVSDTLPCPGYNHPFTLWEMKPEHEAHALRTLSQSYNVEGNPCC